MKRIEIPIIERKDNLNEDVVTYLPKTYSLKELSEKYLNNNISIYELVYLYNIYNIRTISEIYHYFDFDNGLFFNKKFLHPKLGDWLVDSKIENNQISDYLNELLWEIGVREENDYAKIFDCSCEEVTDNIDELTLEPDRYVVFLGDIWDDKKYVRYPRLKYVSGNLSLIELTDAKGLGNLVAVGKDAEFLKLSTADGLEKLASVGGSMYLWKLADISGLSNLKSVGKNLYIGKRGKLINNELNNLEFVGGYLALYYEKWINSLNKLRYIGNNLNISFKDTPVIFKSLEYVGGNITTYQEDKSNIDIQFKKKELVKKIRHIGD